MAIHLRALLKAGAIAAVVIGGGFLLPGLTFWVIDQPYGVFWFLGILFVICALAVYKTLTED
jgi:hypothetical protein